MTNARFPNHNRLVELAIICIFVSALSVPLLTWLVQKDVFYSEVEKRELHPFPVITGLDSVTGLPIASAAAGISNVTARDIGG